MSQPNFASVFEDWEYQQANLLAINLPDETYTPVDVGAACERACDILNIHADSEGVYVVPLFAKSEPRPTNDYVYYRPDREEIGWYDTGFGVERFAACERLADREIGHRLRYWLSDNHHDIPIGIDDSRLPPDSIPPVDTLSEADEAAFFDQLREFVREERRTEKATHWETYRDTGLETAIHQNRVSGPFIKMSETTGDSGNPAFIYQLLLDEDDEDRAEIDLRSDEGLFNGNLCILDVDGHHEEFPIEVELLSVDDPTITFQPDWGAVEDRTTVENVLRRDKTEVWVHELLNPIPFDRRLRAINQVKQHPAKRQLITGQRPAKFSANKFALPESRIELNEYQQDALNWADSASDVVCIHGPPGTGKTRTLTAYVETAVSNGQSVLVTAHSNQAVDNLLVGDSTESEPEADTLHALHLTDDSAVKIARAGNNTRNPVVQTHYLNRSIDNATVVGATTSGAAKFDQNQFDIAVVDEATQASRPATAIALNAAEKLVLAGDHKQLPPYCADETMQDEEMHISLFEHLLQRYDDEISVLLRKQYRMHEAIAEYPNTAFYGNTLETAARNREWTISDLNPLVGIQIDGDEHRESHGNSVYNPAEAAAVAKQVKLLAIHDIDPGDIGVITAYSGQTSEIRRQLRGLDIENLHQVTVDTVDSFQGGERDAIIVSFVRSNPGGHSGFLEFPDEGPRRLNVALTRARKRLVLIGNWDTLGTIAPHRDPTSSCAPLYDRLAQHLHDTGVMLTPTTQK